MRKRLLFLSFATLLFGAYSLGRLYYFLTDGFSVSNITESFAWHPAWEVSPPSQTSREEIAYALAQDYIYLGKGCQSYVFSSEDGRYVLKFFKYQRYRPNIFGRLFPRRYHHRLLHKQEKRERFCQSWKLAYENFPETSGTLFVQLNHAKETSPISLFDKMGRRHRVDLAHHQFLLQRKGTPFSDAIAAWEASGEHEKSLLFLERLVSLLLEEYETGYFDNDPALVQNTGMLNGSPLHLDVGQFQYNKDRKGLSRYKEDFHRKMVDLRAWLASRYPALADWVGREMHERLDDETLAQAPLPNRCY